MPAQMMFVLTFVCACAAVHAGLIKDIKDSFHEFSDTAKEAYMEVQCKVYENTDACYQLFIRQHETEFIVGGVLVAVLIIGLCVWCCCRSSCCERNNRGIVYVNRNMMSRT